mmetsp:Transcript_52297/g.67069  ORF Transcript_52297/g.67069 Transcript_52297/m.67069 type:complete len:217 (+) Transcript_52297:128-778(+)
MERESFGGIRQPWGWENVEEYEMTNSSTDNSLMNHGEEVIKKDETNPLLREKESRFFSFPGLIIGFMFICLILFLGAGINNYEDHNKHIILAPRCMDNSACDNLGMVGDCCPTPTGINLDCCFEVGNVVTHKLTKIGACDDNSVCAALGIMGTCCHDDDDAPSSLDCCLDPDNKVTPPHEISAACLANSACKFAELSGNCCPSDEGVMLGCCPPLD